MPLVIDLFCGLGGWAEGFRVEGWDCIGVDIERHDYGSGGYPGKLILADALSLWGDQFKRADAIVASPPCQKYSYMAMPWGKAKALAAWYAEHPLRQVPLNALFNAAFRLQREASEAAGRHIPMVVENVVGAQKWVGRAAWHHGSYYLWGDVPAIMPFTGGQKNSGGSWFGQRDGQELARNDPRDFRRDESGEWVNAPNGVSGGHNHPGNALDGKKVPGISFSGYGTPGYKPQGLNVTAAQRYREGNAANGIKQGGNWWHDPESITRRTSSRSDSRKAASAQIAKIPFELSSHIARYFKP